MNYLISIITAVITFPFIALLFTFIFILYEYHKYGSINKYRVFIVYSFILYMVIIYFLVILPLPSRESVINNTNMIQIIPFSFIRDFINETSLIITRPSTYLKAVLEPCFYIVIFNIIMTIPFGMYLRYYFKCSLKKVIVFGFLLSLFFELTQATGLYFIYPKPYRLFDIDDLFLNTLGSILGYFVMGIIDKYLPTRDDIDKKSYSDGKVVSGFRRITIFLMDLFIYFIITYMFYSIQPLWLLQYLIFIMYYVVIPLLIKGYTLGGLFLNVKVVFRNYNTLKRIIRNIGLFIYYLGVPKILITFIRIIIGHNFILIIYLMLVMILILFYPVHIIFLIKNSRLYYDRLFKISYISTVKKKCFK